MPSPTVADLRARLSALTLADEHRLGRRLEAHRRQRDEAKQRRLLERLSVEVDTAEHTMTRRAGLEPLLDYPASLPVSQAHDDLVLALREHQVVVLAGETGSGKTTQLPKMLLELGRGRRGMVGHTQPRRIAARAVAERIADEMGTEVGATVGYAVRFTDQVGPDTMLKLMTDGLLVAEIQRDPLLLRYDAIIVDEAHERSLTIDFVLGYLKRLLPRRPDLQLVITSATIDPYRFAAHFGGAPVLEVSGRTYPVEIRYRPVEEPDTDPMQALCAAVDEVCAEGPGDVLVFLSGEREIRDAADALRDHTRGHVRPPEVLPLYGRLSASDQHKVFATSPGRRVVLATNVAETSLTVPGITYVVDTGTARISRYSQRLKVQRLPIERVSQASANQRSGRCGRTSDGIAIRLYSEDDFVSRPEFTEPEILRTNLASVVLQMAALGLGELADFPFVDAPDSRNVRDGVQLLEELAALSPPEAGHQPGTPTQRLTDVGRRLARLPLDPRLGRMVLEAERLGCVREVVVIAAALSIQDPRERPSDKQAQADQAHARFRDPSSDLTGHLRLWQYLRTEQRARSSSGFRRLCRTEFLHYLRVREWQDMVAQLRRILTDLGVAESSAPDDPDRVHQALLSGLLSHVGLRQQETRDYLGARNARFAIFPGSALFKSRPAWVMAGELVETSRLWGRDVARIDPSWIEPLAGHLVRRTYAEPHWERRRGGAVALETVTLYGIPVVVGRKIQLDKVDAPLARELFIRHALVEGDWDTRHQFLAANRELLAEVADLEERTRRRDIVVDEQALVDFYDARVPEQVVSSRHFDAWWKKEQRRQPDLLRFSRDLLVRTEADTPDEWSSEYPDSWHLGQTALPLTYVFDPGSARDGVTVDVPLPLLHHLDAADFAWQVPGLRLDLVTELLRSLPKPLRRQLVPAPDHAARIVTTLQPGDRGLLDALAHELLRSTGVPVNPDDFDLEKLPAHLRLTFRVVDDDGQEVAAGKDLPTLQERLRTRLRATLTEAARGVERAGLRDWGDIGELPRSVSSTRAGHSITGYPALVDDRDSVSVRVFESAPAQAVAMRAGTRRLIRLSSPSPLAPVVRGLANQTKLALAHSAYASVPSLLDDCADCACDHLVAAVGGPAWDAAAFARLRDAVRAGLVPATEQVVEQVARILSIAQQARMLLDAVTSPLLAAAREDVEMQLDELVPAGFVGRTGWDRLPDVVRYVTGVRLRLERMADDPRRDLARLDEILAVVADYERARASAARDHPPPPVLEEARWLIEELRLGLFAPSVRTARPASVKRVRRVLEAVAPVRATH